MAAPIVHIFETGEYEAQIGRGSELLSSGGVVVLPTETVYGAAGLINSESARARINTLRGDTRKPFIIHVAKRDDARPYLGPTNDFAERLLRRLWPGPVALMFDVPADRRREAAALAGVAEQDIYEGDSITLRCPDHIVVSDVLSTVKGPVAMTLAGTSAGGTNWSGERMAEELNGKVDLIFDAGPSRYSKPSTILKVGQSSYQIVRQGVYDERIIERLLRTTILFVCSGNTCRSPMAEAITRRVLSEKLHVPEDDLEKRGVQVVSAGAMAMPGSRAAGPAIDVVREMGGDLTRHRSRMLSVELIHQADMIFTMSQNHARAVTTLVPSAAEKVAALNPQGD